MDERDRRAPGVKRVPVETVVEICGREAGQPAFEAQSVELSGRGMHVRTSHVPELDTPIVLRFVDQGREVVIEGEVAWNRETEGSGEFGIRFTALDNQGVQVLKELCGLVQAVPPADDADSPEPAPASVRPGTAVKLHIEGLGAPMKACVRDGGRRRVNVGSNLEFLKMGQTLLVEDIAQGEHRDARIDGVSVAVEPETGVPQLVVSLRYDGEEATPEPSVVDAAAPQRPAPKARGTQPQAGAVPAAAQAEPAAPAVGYSGEYYEDEYFEDDFEDDPLKVAFEKLTKRVGHVARQTSGVVRGVSHKAATAMETAIKGAGDSVTKLKAKAGHGEKPRRTAAAPRRTAPPPQTRRSAQRAAGSRHGNAEPTMTKKLRARVAAGGLAAIVGLGWFLNSEMDAPEAPAPAMKAEPIAPGPETATATPPPTPAQAPAQAAANPAPGAPVVADVPLFGPTPMATAKPEPLNALPPAEPIPVEKLGAVDDESFDDAPEEPTPRKNSAAKPFQHGRLHLPIIHRIRLDQEGEALAGTRTPTGFSVLVPERKTMENGKVIAKRDDRIVKVETKNTAQGAKITFTFRKTIPPYKVRLKQDFVEFFISAPEKKP